LPIRLPFVTGGGDIPSSQSFGYMLKPPIPPPMPPPAGYDYFAIAANLLFFLLAIIESIGLDAYIIKDNLM